MHFRLMLYADVQNYSILENLAWNANTVKLNFGMKKEQKNVIPQRKFNSHCVAKRESGTSAIK